MRIDNRWNRKLMPWLQPLSFLLLLLMTTAAAIVFVDLPVASAAEAGNHVHGDTGITIREAILYTIRTVYYAAVLISCGFMLWLAGLGSGQAAAIQREMLHRYSLLALRVLVIAALLHVFVQSRELIGKSTGLSAEWFQLFFETRIGLSWTAALILSLLGFMAWRRRGRVTGVWALLLVGAESWNGHVRLLGSEKRLLATFLDFVHLAGAAIWTGGLVFLFLLWIVNRQEAARFAERFTAAAWISMVLLVVTGACVTLLLLPDINYLAYSTWGTLLLIKCALVLIIVLIGFIMRLRVRRGELPHAALIKLDLYLMCAVIAIVAAFTNLSPVPNNEVINFHKMGIDKHLTVIISPNAPGNNQMKVKVWLSEQSGGLKSVNAALYSLDKNKNTSILIPLQAYQEEQQNSFPGFVEWTYRSDNAQIPFPGKWAAVIRVADNEGGQWEEKVIFRNY